MMNMSTMDRRSFLAIVASGSMGLAGCSTLIGPDPTPTDAAHTSNPTESSAPTETAIDDDGDSEGTEALPIRFWLEEMSLSESEQDSANPIVYGNLSTAEQELVQTALNEGEYTTEHASPAVGDIRDRIEQRTGGGETLEAYLRRNDTYYRIGYADGDHIIAHPDH